MEYELVIEMFQEIADASERLLSDHGNDIDAHVYSIVSNILDVAEDGCKYMTDAFDNRSTS